MNPGPAVYDTAALPTELSWRYLVLYSVLNLFVDMVRSRLYSIKEKRELRQASFLIVVAIVLLIGFVFWGLPTLALLVGNNLIRQTGQTQQEIEIRPASPVLTDVPESTREDKITISGYAQPGLEVTLYINAQERAKMLVDEAGEFSFVGVPLDPDVNEIYAFAYNPTNKLESEKSRVYTLIKDKKPPELVDHPCPVVERFRLVG